MSHKLKSEDLYAEFTDVENSKIRYFMATVCRYKQRNITSCVCGICKELKKSINMSAYIIHENDEYHYIWIRGYSLRQPHVIKSDTAYHSEGVHTWTDLYINRDFGCWNRMDNRSTKRSTSSTTVHEGLITIHDCTATVDHSQSHKALIQSQVLLEERQPLQTVELQSICFTIEVNVKHTRPLTSISCA